MKRIRVPWVWAAAVVVMASAGCGSPSSDSPSPTAVGGDIVAPVTMSSDDLQGATVELTVGQVLNITTGDLAPGSYAGEVADPAVAAFTPGRSESAATYNPGIDALHTGSTAVTLTNEDSGIQSVDFTVVVTD